MDSLPEAVQVTVVLASLGITVFLAWYFSRRARTELPSTLSERGKLLLEERIPLVRHLSEANKARLFESVSALRKVGSFQSRVPTADGGQAFIDIQTDDQAILFGLMGLAMLYRSAPAPDNIFPLVLTSETVVSTDPIYRGEFKKGRMKFISRDDLNLDQQIHALGISPLVFQFAKCLDTPELTHAKPEHRAEFNSLLDSLDAAYERRVLEPARIVHEETGEAQDILTGIGFLFEMQKKYFGSNDEFIALDGDVRDAFAVLYGERRILN